MCAIKGKSFSNCFFSKIIGKYIFWLMSEFISMENILRIMTFTRSHSKQSIKTSKHLLPSDSADLWMLYKIYALKVARLDMRV